jgi:hypothetical protein
MRQISLEDQARAIERWKARHGITGRTYVSANEGLQRTPSKRALLRSMHQNAKSLSVFAGKS